MIFQAVNSHSVKRSIDGLILKFDIHAQSSRSRKLKELIKNFQDSPIFTDHEEVCDCDV